MEGTIENNVDAWTAALRVQFNDGRIEYGTGTPVGGVYLLTNRHVLEHDGASIDSIQCRWPDHVGLVDCKEESNVAKASVYALHDSLDLAILKVEKDKLAMPYPALCDPLERLTSGRREVVGYPIGATNGTNNGAGPEVIRKRVEMSAIARSDQAQRSGVEVEFDFAQEAQNTVSVGDRGSPRSDQPDDGCEGASGGPIYALSATLNRRIGFLGIFAAATYSHGTKSMRRRATGFMIPIEKIREWDKFVPIDPWKRKANFERARRRLENDVFVGAFRTIAEAAFTSWASARKIDPASRGIIGEILNADLNAALAFADACAQGFASWISGDSGRRHEERARARDSLRTLFRVIVPHALVAHEQEKLHGFYIKNLVGRKVLDLVTKRIDFVAATVAAMHERELEDFVVRFVGVELRPNFHEVIDTRGPVPNSGLHPIRNVDGLIENLSTRLGRIDPGDKAEVVGKKLSPIETIREILVILNPPGPAAKCLPAFVIDDPETLDTDTRKELENLQAIGFLAIVMKEESTTEPEKGSKGQSSPSSTAFAAESEQQPRTRIFRALLGESPS